MSRKPNSKRLLLTERDFELLVSLHDYRYLTTGQVERLHFPSPQTAIRRLRLLSVGGYVDLFRVPAIGERLAALSETGAKAAAEHRSQSDSNGIAAAKKDRPKDPFFLRHFLAASDFRIALTKSCSVRSDLRLVGLLPEHLAKRTGTGSIEKFLRDMTRDSSSAGKQITHCPDAVFALGRAERAALFFLEIDRGTEVLSDEERGVGKAIRFYLSYLLAGGYQRYRDDFGIGQDFKGFRVLFVTSSEQRVRNIRQRAGAIPFEPAQAKRFIWLATDAVLRSDRLLEHPWISLDPADNASYRIAPFTPNTGEQPSWQSL